MFCGRVIDCREIHPEKERYPISMTLSGMVIEFREVQPKNVPWLIDVILFGSEM